VTSIVALDESHGLDGFTSGDPVRDTWLRRRAAENQQSGYTRTYLLIDDAGTVDGFYALAVGSVLRTSLPGALRRNAPDPVSCVILAQLAISSGQQGNGYSRTLVLDAMERTLKLGAIAGCRLLVVHPARPDLVGYYERFGFLSATTTPPMMAMTLADIRKIQAGLGLIPLPSPSPAGGRGPG
jgi:hypothetical protein